MRLSDLQHALVEIDGDQRAAYRLVYDARDIVLIGNGGSAAIASHIAVDFTKNARLKARAFNDASLLTCYANDYGHDYMFVEALRAFAEDADLLIAISSSGRSKNIINAAQYASGKGMNVLTLTGFDPDNTLRSIGLVNLYVPSRDYGTVEITHLAILHSMVPA